jgi:hypothetical protein
VRLAGDLGVHQVETHAAGEASGRRIKGDVERQHGTCKENCEVKMFS